MLHPDALLLRTLFTEIDFLPHEKHPDSSGGRVISDLQRIRFWESFWPSDKWRSALLDCSACLLHLDVVILAKLSRYSLWTRRMHTNIQWLQWPIKSSCHTSGVDNNCNILFKHDLLALLHGVAAHRQIRSCGHRWLNFTCHFCLLYPYHAPIWSCCPRYFFS